MPKSLPERNDQYIRNFLYDHWNSANTASYDPTISDTSDSNFLLLTTSKHGHGGVFPSVVVENAREQIGAGSTYDYMTSNGVGQNRDGFAIINCYAEVRDTGDYNGNDAHEITNTLANEIERICIDNPDGDSSLLYAVGSARANVDDDAEKTPTVAIEQVEFYYNWLRE